MKSKRSCYYTIPVANVLIKSTHISVKVKLEKNGHIILSVVTVCKENDVIDLWFVPGISKLFHLGYNTCHTSFTYLAITHATPKETIRSLAKVKLDNNGNIYSGLWMFVMKIMTSVYFFVPRKNKFFPFHLLHVLNWFSFGTRWRKESNSY